MGSRVANAEGESGYILVLETSRAEQANKKPSKTAQQMQDRENSWQKVTKRRVLQRDFQQIQTPSVQAPQQAEICYIFSNAFWPTTNMIPAGF